MQSRKELRDLKRTLTKVRKSEEKIKNLSDEELSALTEQFKSRYSDGESLESLMPEAFAAICEADYRVLGKRPYDVQILAAAALHGGYLAEMNTGEGKTLSATMPLYLNALIGKSCMLVTTNEYLASRDGAEMGAVYNFMGLTCSYPDADDTKKQDDDEKRQFYSADIIYTTNGALGFDFLFDNLVKKKEDRFLCDFHYVIIDEADSVLLDSAIMPLVISGVPRVQSNLYDVCDFFVTTLVEDIDYIEEDKAVWLTPKGVKFAESFFGISNFYGKENFEINRHVTLSLRAHKLLKNKKDYVVTDKKEVELFDGATGRLMHGVKLRGGQHQAIEAKEKVEISQEYRTVASVTFQNLFMMFDKMAGMSGTLMDAKDELFETYGKHVVRIPTNRPLKRVDRKDRYFKNGHDQFWTAVDDVIRLHETGQPVLVVLNSVTDTDLFSRLLIEKNIPHNVLNASNAFWEAQIIAGAGQMNAVTVATTMAGRGTDIKLGDGVKELGGLAVIGIGRMNNSRSERQARGRAGRQGDPGFSQYYVSLEDDIVGAEDDDKLQRYIDGKKRIGKRKIKRIVNQCQKLSVESEEMNRKKSLQYDQVLQRQRDLIYATRKNLLDGASVEQEKIVEIAKENISDFVNHFDCIQSNKKHGRRRGRKKDKLIGNLLAKETENETFAACRLGGDEFLIFMPYSDRASVESVIKRIFEGFESAREADCEIKEAALSAGLCMTTKGAMFESDYTKADKALYYVKQNCKGSYFFYEQLLADNKENTNLSADLRNVAKLLKESGSYTGALDLNYREFARIYEFVNNVGDRHNHNCYLVMVTMNTLPEQLADIEEIEKALDCMEQSIRSKIRKVDVCTRYSSMQYLIILFEPQENQIPNVMERIFMHYYELCDRENFKPQYEYIKMTEVK